MTDADAMEKMSGSTFFVRAANEEEVWENLRKDPYYSSGEVVSPFTYCIKFSDYGKTQGRASAVGYLHYRGHVHDVRCPQD